eukprot:4824255-Amphidinium_carterae.2
MAGRCWVSGDMETVLGLSGVQGIFFNPPLATQLLYRVTWSEDPPATLFEAHQATPSFAGIVMAKDKFGVRTRVAEASAPAVEEWEVRGLPLRLTEKAVTDVMEALGIAKPGVRREARGRRLVRWDKFPVPAPLALNAETGQHRIKAGNDTFVVWFHKCGGGRARSAKGSAKGSNKGTHKGARSRSKSRGASRNRKGGKGKKQTADNPGEDEHDGISDAHFEEITQEARMLQSGAKKMKPAAEIDVAMMAQRMVDLQLLMARMAKQVEEMKATSTDAAS